jgi:hypothetical protein
MAGTGRGWTSKARGSRSSRITSARTRKSTRFGYGCFLRVDTTGFLAGQSQPAILAAGARIAGTAAQNGPPNVAEEASDLGVLLHFLSPGWRLHKCSC